MSERKKVAKKATKATKKKATKKTPKKATRKVAKVSAKSSKALGTKAATPKKTTTRRVTKARKPAVAAVVQTSDQPKAVIRPALPVVPPITARPERRESMVAEAAYFLAEQRGFAPGHALDDWLHAESLVAQHVRSRA